MESTVCGDKRPTPCGSMLNGQLANLSMSMVRSPSQILEEISSQQKCNILSEDFAIIMDKRDSLAKVREQFDYPLKKNFSHVTNEDNKNEDDKECIYLCGNSLGLKPKRTNKEVMIQLEKWGKTSVEMHFEGRLPAALCDRYGRESMGRLVGADPSSVCLMNALSVNLNLLLVSFYQPTKDRYKILIESGAFPSDRYAVKSQAAMRGYDPNEAILQVSPRNGEQTLRTEDILQVIEAEGSSIAVVCLSGVQYYTGQKFDMEKITKAGQAKGCMVGWDLAHAVGNVSLQLDKWGVDFACWCTYKYLNSGPGSIAAAYVNKRHNQRRESQFHGWWSNTAETRFQMLEDCDVAEGIDSFRLSNPSPLLVACVMASLEIFDENGMDKQLEKQYLLTGYLELLLNMIVLNSDGKNLAKIITPRDPLQRGCQLSIQFNFNLSTIHEEIKKKGIMCDIRLPDVLRVAPVPLYNSYQDVYKFVQVLHEVINTHHLTSEVLAN